MSCVINTARWTLTVIQFSYFCRRSMYSVQYLPLFLNRWKTTFLFLLALFWQIIVLSFEVKRTDDIKMISCQSPVYRVCPCLGFLWSKICLGLGFGFVLVRGFVLVLGFSGLRFVLVWGLSWSKVCPGVSRSFPTYQYKTLYIKKFEEFEVKDDIWRMLRNKRGSETLSEVYGARFKSP